MSWPEWFGAAPVGRGPARAGIAVRIITKGKYIDVTPSMRALAERKVRRLKRFAVGIALAEVEFDFEPTKSVADREVVQVTLEFAGNVLRAEARAADARVALDEVVDQLQRQLKSYRWRERARTRGRTPAERFVASEAGPTAGEYGAVTPPSPMPAEPEHRRRPGAG